jgi:hypothetical protein
VPRTLIGSGVRMIPTGSNGGREIVISSPRGRRPCLYTPPMRTHALPFVLALVAGPSFNGATANAQTGVQAVSVSFPAAQSSKALDGRLLLLGQVLSHPLVIGELAMGSFKRRDVLLSELGDLPRAKVADHDEVLHFVSGHMLFGLGIGYIDAHLLAAVRLMPGALLWTRDKHLHRVASKLGLAAAQR